MAVLFVYWFHVFIYKNHAREGWMLEEIFYQKSLIKLEMTMMMNDLTGLSRRFAPHNDGERGGW